MVKYGIPCIFKRKITTRKFQYKKINKEGFYPDLSVFDLREEGEAGWELCGIEEVQVQNGEIERTYVFKKEI